MRTISDDRRLTRAAKGLALGVVLTVSLLCAPAGQAQVTIGPPLNQPANAGSGCEIAVLPELLPIVGAPPSCTFWGSFDPNAAWSTQVPKGQWVLTRARVRTGPRVGPMVFTIVQAMRSQAGAQGVICCMAPVESQVFTPAPNQINQVPLQLPVQNTVQLIDGEPVEIVDYLGISLLTLGSAAPVHVAAPGAVGSAATTSVIAPAMRQGQQALNGPTLPRSTLLVNVDLQPCPGAGSQVAEAKRAGCLGGSPAGGGATPQPPGSAGTASPSNDFALAGKRGLKIANGRGKVRFRLPGPGTIELADAKARSAKAAERPRRKGKRKRVRTSSATAEAAGRLKVPLKLTRRGKRALNKRARKDRRLAVKVNATYTPTGGQPSTEKLKLKLSKKAKRNGR